MMNNEHKHARRETPAMQVFARYLNLCGQQQSVRSITDCVQGYSPPWPSPHPHSLFYQFFFFLFSMHPHALKFMQWLMYLWNRDDNSASGWRLKVFCLNPMLLTYLANNHISQRIISGKILELANHSWMVRIP